MTRTRGRVAILGGGMAGLSAAWRLSEGAWRDRFDSITVYQRGWRVGGKGASSRGPNGRIEEHGLHVWMGSYDNAFALLRECYAELDRANTDPEAPIRTWDQAFIPSDSLGIADRFGEEWLVWPGTLGRNDELPGEPNATGRELTAIDFLRRALQLVLDFADSLPTPDGDAQNRPDPGGSTAEWLQVVRWGTLAMLAALTKPIAPESIPSVGLNHVLDAIREALDYERRPDHRRFWLFLSLVTATARGIVSDNLVTDPRGFRAINDEDFCAWVLRHEAHPDVVDFPLVRGMYDMVFGYEEGDADRPALAAGVALLLTGIAFFQYKGAFFWKMTAGMGDVVIAPLYQALRRRGVRFEFFHRVDALHLDDRRQAVGAITIGRQARLAEGVDEYHPLIRIGGLPVFPDRPLADQLDGPARGDLESHFGERDDVETLVLRRGVDFDHVVLATSLAMVEVITGELSADSPQWHDMVTQLRTVATQAFQLWLRPDETTLGWHRPGVTTSGYVAPFDTWASMPQTLWAEQWPPVDSPGTVAYFCGALNALWPNTESTEDYVEHCREKVFTEAVAYLDKHVGLYLPGAVTEHGFAWHLLVGANGHRGAAALKTQHVSVNIDPSDRYVQSVPGSDKYRLRSDESGYDNLVLAGDWTDSGVNAGCIEAAVISGLQAANALVGRGHRYRIRGFYQP
ncbi:FAD-dependent oxidoreductase [Mycobacterium sp. Marseille-P9652]|uniref:FAD-dependent oxidoreductase n=1 Tax=Mycobacterium sp. Marseille-P9652 TaxID=2654950 RepID=UPI0012E7C696|nr:FAD-dependent oxidoreductase [Mycobacterium sp. Marseille-P9652]